MSDQPIFPPDFEDNLVELKREIFATLNCVQIGQIQSYNATEQTAEVQIQFKVRVNSTTIADYPVLIDCPVFVLQGGGAYIDMPVATGDYCVVLFNDRNIDVWWNSATIAAPDNRRKHSLSDGIALVGINPLTATRTLDGSVVRILGPSGPGAEEFAARENDTTISSSNEDNAFWIFWNAFFGVITGAPIPEPGAGNPSAFQAALAAAITAAGGVPTAQAGRIDKGSDEVKIG